MDLSTLVKMTIAGDYWLKDSCSRVLECHIIKNNYKAFFEDMVLKNYFEQYSYHREIRDPENKIVQFPERINENC